MISSIVAPKYSHAPISKSMPSSSSTSLSPLVISFSSAVVAPNRSSARSSFYKLEIETEKVFNNLALEMWSSLVTLGLNYVGPTHHSFLEFGHPSITVLVQ